MFSHLLFCNSPSSFHCVLLRFVVVFACVGCCKEKFQCDYRIHIDFYFSLCVVCIHFCFLITIHNCHQNPLNRNFLQNSERLSLTSILLDLLGIGMNLSPLQMIFILVLERDLWERLMNRLIIFGFICPDFTVWG